jgi:PPOX class probable F420-dependent enzyme
MPRPPLSPSALELMAAANPAVLATIREDGTPHTVAVWFDWVEGRVLLNMDTNRKRLRNIEANPTVSLSILDGENWLRQLTVRGPATLEPDDGLVTVDQLARRYLGTDYPIRDRARVTAWIEPEHWFLWDARGRGEAPLAIRPRLS